MSCFLCSHTDYVTILNKPAIPIWTNASQEVHNWPKAACVLRQCLHCGHVYQPTSSVLNQALKDIYSSHQAQLSASMGKGNWGQERGRSFLKLFFSLVNLKQHDSVLEIGCDDGYLLKAIQDRGGINLTGIEPSLPKTVEKDGIALIKGFAQKGLPLPRKYSLIFASSVFEHIEDINGMLQFCVENLKLGGELYFSVPNAAQYIEEGDPALFTHQHIQYFTEDSARTLLARHGFTIKNIIKDKDSLEVLAQKTKESVKSGEVHLYTDYENKLSAVLTKAHAILKKPHVIVHAANNTLNNILGWLGQDFSFTLVDNDSTKHGKIYFGKKVCSLDEVNLHDFKEVLIIPNAFRHEIKMDYQKRGFRGDIHDLTVVEAYEKKA